MWQHVKRVDKLSQAFSNAQSRSEEIYFVRKNEQNYKKCKFQEATIIVQVESESRSKTIVASSSDFSYTKCAGLSRRSVALYLPGISLNGAILGEKEFVSYPQNDSTRNNRSVYDGGFILHTQGIFLRLRKFRWTHASQ